MSHALASIVDLIVEEPAWEAALPELPEIAEQAARMALAVLPEGRRAAEICVMACSDDRIAALNAEFRGKPVPTNVLSWPAFDLAPDQPGEGPALPPDSAAGADGFGEAGFGPIHLGDVAIALQTVVREADAAPRPLKNHVLHLILHGCLHLLGYDHDTPEDAEVMERIERRAMLAAGHPDPYA